MASNRKLLVLPGDGIGPEVMGEVRRVVDWFDRRQAVGFDLQEDLVGGAAIDAHGVPIADATMEKAMVADSVLLFNGRELISPPECKANEAGACGTVPVLVVFLLQLHERQMTRTTTTSCLLSSPL